MTDQNQQSDMDVEHQPVTDKEAEPGSSNIIPHRSTTKESGASTSNEDNTETASETQSLDLTTPETIRPFCKAGPRKKSSTGSIRKRQTAVLTDTPVKEALKELKMASKARINTGKKLPKKSKKGTRRNSRVNGKSQASTPESSEDEEWFCLVCMEPYSNSRPGENWVQCASCKLWAHDD